MEKLFEGNKMLLAAFAAAAIAGIFAGFRKSSFVGPRGLKNLGNTCYINAILQAFASCPALIQYVTMIGAASESCQLARACTNICTHLNTATAADVDDHTPLELICERVFAATALRSGMQEDAHEFLELILGMFERELQSAHALRLLGGALPENAIALASLSRPSRLTSKSVLASGPVPMMPLCYSALFNPFRFTMATRRVCTTCNTPKPLLLANHCVLTVSLSSNSGIVRLGRTHLTTLLLDTISPENLTDVHCETCSKRSGFPMRRSFLQSVSMAACPQVLCININRLVYTQYGVAKANDPVQLNEQLNLAMLAGAPVAYVLRAVIVHLGGAQEGHYTCFRRRGAAWFLISDDHVRRAALSEVLRSNPSLVFFERVTTASDLPPPSPTVNTPTNISTNENGSAAGPASSPDQQYGAAAAQPEESRARDEAI